MIKKQELFLYRMMLKALSFMRVPHDFIYKKLQEDLQKEIERLENENIL